MPYKKWDTRKETGTEDNKLVVKKNETNDVEKADRYQEVGGKEHLHTGYERQGDQYREYFAGENYDRKLKEND